MRGTCEKCMLMGDEEGEQWGSGYKDEKRRIVRVRDKGEIEEDGVKGRYLR